jgi:hypothetical protein
MLPRMNAIARTQQRSSKTLQAGAAPSPAGVVPRFRPQLRAALDLIALEGMTQREAAKRAGMNETVLARALKKPHVSAELDRLRSMAYEEGAKHRAIARAAALRVGLDLLHNAKSEAVKARMVELFTRDPDGPSVVVQVNSAAPGYVYRRPTDSASGASDDQPIEIEGKATEV